MVSITRVDQAVLLLKDRLRRLQERSAGAAAKTASSAGADKQDALQPLRQLARKGAMSDGELRRALVRTLLADSLGEELAGSLRFQSVAEEVARILEQNEQGRELLSRALAELD